jgi:hypothetical protein
MFRQRCRSVVLVCAALFPSVAGASQLFDVNAQTTSGSPQTLNVGSGNLPNLVKNLITNTDQFESLNNQDVSATLRYAGINNAILITKNSSDTSATVRIPSIGLTRTFNAANADDLKNQIIDYIKKNGASEYGRFLRVVNQNSDVGVTDGNPLATTSMLADHQYFTFGLEPAPFPVDAPGKLDSAVAPTLRFNFRGGVANTNAGSGYFLNGAFDVDFRFSNRVGLVFSSPLMYRNFQGANIYETGSQAALPIAILPARGDRSLSWTVTPSGSLGAAGSLELASGGTFAGGGVTSSLSYQLDTFTFTLADHYSYFHGYPIHFGDYHFNTDLEQQVLKNGLKVTKSFGQTLYLDGNITYTNFLDHAAIRNYLTPGAGIGVRFGTGAGLRVGYAADLASGFTVHQGNVQLYFNY